MSEQPPVQPSNQPAEGNPPTLPMPAAGSAPPAGPGAPAVGPTASPSGPPAPPAGPPPGPPGVPPASPGSPNAARPGFWHRTTSTTGGRVGLAISAAVLAGLLILGIGIAGILVLRHHDRVDLVGQRADRQSLGQGGPGNGNGKAKGLGHGRGLGNGNGNGNDDGQDVPEPAMPGMPGGRGTGGLGNLLNGAALHGTVSATVNGSVQALVFQRGEVTAVSATSITLKSSDGFVGTYGRNAATIANGVAPVKGGQALVLARASDKVALRTITTPAKVGVAPSS